MSSFNKTNQTPNGYKGKRVNDDEHDIPMNDIGDEGKDDTASEPETHATLHEAYYST